MSSLSSPPLDYSDGGPGIMISLCILAALATAAVALRFWARKLSRLSLGMEDYLTLAALIMHHGLLISSGFLVVQGGLGRDIRLVEAENPYAIVILFKALFAAEVCYGCSACFVKLAVLALYKRIFPTATVNLFCLIVGSACIMWLVTIEIVNVIQCRPLRAFWDQELQELPTTMCLDTILFFLGNSIANCIIDCATIALPIHEVLKLHTSSSKKLGICGVFLLGGLAFAASLARTISVAVIYNQGITNFTKQFVTAGVAGAVEIYVAIIGACAPVLVPVYRKLRYGDAVRTTQNSSNAKNNSNSANIINKLSNKMNVFHSFGRTSFDRLTNEDNVSLVYSNQNHHDTQVISSEGATHAPNQNTQDFPLQGIRVKKDVTWSVSNKPPS